jgi:hypothetical protein
MCLAGPGPAVRASVSDAVAMAQAALGWLAGADAAALTPAEQAERLRALERAESIEPDDRGRAVTFRGTTDIADRAGLVLRIPATDGGRPWRIPGTIPRTTSPPSPGPAAGPATRSPPRSRPMPSASPSASS